MLATAGRYLAPAVLVVALSLSPLLGYATTHVLLALAALAALWLWLAPSTVLRTVPLPRFAGEDVGEIVPPRDPPPRGGGGSSEARWRGQPSPPSLLFALAFTLIAISALVTTRQPADLLPLLGLSALLFHAPLARLIGGADLSRVGLAGAFVGLAIALYFRFGLGMDRAAEGFWLTDPFRLAATTLLGAFLGLGLLFTELRWRWLSLVGLVAAVVVILLTGSRGALVGLPVLLVASGLSLRPRPITIVATLAGTVAITTTALFIQLPGTVRARLWDVIAGMLSGGIVPDAAIDVRLGLYHAAAELFAAAPIVGHGWGATTMSEVLALLRPDQLNWGEIPHLHNDIAQFAVSGGLLGLASWLLILAAPLAGYLRLPDAQRTPQRRHAVLTLLAAAIVLGLPDTMLAAPMTLTIYVVLTAAVVGRTNYAPSTSLAGSPPP